MHIHTHTFIIVKLIYLKKNPMQSKQAKFKKNMKNTQILN